MIDDPKLRAKYPLPWHDSEFRNSVHVNGGSYPPYHGTWIGWRWGRGRWWRVPARLEHVPVGDLNEYFVTWFKARVNHVFGPPTNESYR